MTFDIQAEITATIVDAIESGDTDSADWSAPWVSAGGAGLPVNAKTGAAYSGGNIIALWIAAMRFKYASNVWATYKQWQSIGAQVRAGETKTFAVFYK